MTKRKATALRLLQGNPSHRPLPKGEPRPLLVSARCPLDLPDEARPFWRRLAPKLRRLGLLTELDTLAVADMCLCLARLKAAEDLIAREGLLVPGERGLVKNPACQLAREYRAAAVKWGARFGLTPSDRSGLSVGLPEPADPFATFLAKGREEDKA